MEAAEKSQVHAKPRLDFLKEQQTTNGTDPNTYICLLASSGTGKTQLAATASLTYLEAPTIYLYMGRDDGDQRFYRPHVSLASGFFQQEIRVFMKELLVDDNQNKCKSTANSIRNWASSKLDNGSFGIVRILYHLLTGEPFMTSSGTETTFNTRMKLKELKEKIRNNKYLVFLDGVPPKDDDDYQMVLCLRDIFRYLGIAPILMSKHTGAQDYVGNTSRKSLDVWTWIVSTLPKFEPFPLDPQLI
jgi:hypothetical protein